MTDNHACPMCTGTDYAAECAAGRCSFQEEIDRDHARAVAEEERVNRRLAPDWNDQP